MGYKRPLLATLICAFSLVACGGGGGSSSTPGGGSGSGATPAPTPPVIDEWPMYAHDARHTATSQASLNGPLAVAWRYNPQPATGRVVDGVVNAVATVNGPYLHWIQNDSIGGGLAVDSVSSAGARNWTFATSTDYDERHWLSIYATNVIYNDDGQGFVDIGTGKAVATPAKPWTTAYDLWGETISDASGLYLVNDFFVDGARLFVYSLNAAGATRWTANQQVGTKGEQDQAGRLALSNGKLFYAAAYSQAPSPFASGLYAFDASSGQKLNYVTATSQSALSADANNVFEFELPGVLVARAQSDLHVVWSTPVVAGTPYAQPPVVVDGLLIVWTRNNSANATTAYNASTGAKVWSSAVFPAAPQVYGTYYAAAEGSHTLVVTGSDGIHILRLSDGVEVSHTALGGTGVVTNPVIVSDPAAGTRLYVTDSAGVVAYTAATSSSAHARQR